MPIQDAFMGLMLEKGSHDITISYTPAGFKLGLMISIAAVFGIALLIIIPAIVSSKKKT